MGRFVRVIVLARSEVLVEFLLEFLAASEQFCQTVRVVWDVESVDPGIAFGPTLFETCLCSVGVPGFHEGCIVVVDVAVVVATF